MINNDAKKFEQLLIIDVLCHVIFITNWRARRRQIIRRLLFSMMTRRVHISPLRKVIAIWFQAVNLFRNITVSL